ncbi:MAG: HAD family hydrolase [Syntrophomonadaceae bacterium]
MFKAILFDLDGTLLNIDMDVFLQHYFKRMAQLAPDYGLKDSQQLIAQVWKSTDVMIANRDPAVSNEDAFMKDFFAAGSFPEQGTREFFDDYYDRSFPLLHNLCQGHELVPGMIESLLTRSRKVVIATNPVFPIKAIQHRLDWAGIGHFPYDLITSYEVMHFCKPHPEYYQEISDMIGVPPEHCLMVGNDREEDLTAASIGMKTYLVEDGLIDRGSDLRPDWQGTLSQLVVFLENL